MSKRTRRLKGKDIRQNRPGWRKKVIGHKGSGHAYQKPIKIKGKDWEKVD